MMKALYLAIGLLIVGGYAYAGWRGLEIRQTKKGFAPQGVRGKQGSRSVYYGGYRGGK
jgi:hypothetical protein